MRHPTGNEHHNDKVITKNVFGDFSGVTLILPTTTTKRTKHIFGIVLDGVKKRKSNSSPAKEQIQFQSKKLRQTNRILGTETPSQNKKIISSTPQQTPLNKYEYVIGMSWINK